MIPDTPQLVFEGNLPAVVDKNPLLNEALNAPTWPDDVRVGHWPGWATRSRSRTRPRSLFRRQSGTNVLVIGQQDEAALWES